MHPYMAALLRRGPTSKVENMPPKSFRAACASLYHYLIAPYTGCPRHFVLYVCGRLIRYQVFCFASFISRTIMSWSSSTS